MHFLIHFFFHTENSKSKFRGDRIEKVVKRCKFYFVPQKWEELRRNLRRKVQLEYPSLARNLMKTGTFFRIFFSNCSKIPISDHIGKFVAGGHSDITGSLFRLMAVRVLNPITARGTMAELVQIHWECCRTAWESVNQRVWGENVHISRIPWYCTNRTFTLENRAAKGAPLRLWLARDVSALTFLTSGSATFPWTAEWGNYDYW